MATANEVYSFGTSYGQLGQMKSMPSPKIVSEFQTLYFCDSAHIQNKSIISFLLFQIPGITLEQGDTIDHLSVSDAATACITSRRHQIFICTNYTVLRCERYTYIIYNLFFILKIINLILK